IAVIGLTGSGKSSYIAECAEQKVHVGSHLGLCTSRVETYSFQYKGRTVHMIDTPGIDNPSKSDMDVLKEIAQWLSMSYLNQIQLSGIIYLHRISEPRMTASAMANLRVIRKLCGESNLSAIALTTTFWDSVDAAEALARQREMESTSQYWKDMVDRGSKSFSWDDGRSTALRPIDYFLRRDGTDVLDIQKEMVDQNLALDQTAAGIEIQ
ncbi:P-loop containing nucleoside triphosphate hydrolase protein, partial [Phaeosphaeriaceae sp. PMI808]